MSIESEFDLDKLFLPAWAQESPAYNKYANFTERPERGERRGGGGGGPRGPGREGGGGGRPPGGRGQRDDRSRGPRRDGPSRPGGGGGGAPRFERGRFQRDEPRREAPQPLPDVNIALMPDEKGVDSLVKQIKMTGRAYPLFDIGKLILQKPERQQVRFDVIKQDDKIIQRLFVCQLDDSLWLSEDAVVSHVLDKHFDTFYKAERTATEPPKGVYTFVGQCGMSGAILGPPNYHDYQNKLRKLHQERFARMPFEMYKARVKIVRDEEVVKKWLEEQSWKTEYVTLNVPEAEVIRLQTRDDVAKHFRQVHMANIVKEVESHVLSGPASRQNLDPQLQRVVRIAWEEQQRFPLKVVNVLSQQFASRGLQFFKVNKHITHVAIARPHHLDLQATPVSEGVKKIVEFIEANPKCTRRQLLSAIVPSAATPAPDAANKNETTPEQNTVIADLHWLVHQGHVIEFANGTLETAKKPNPRPEPKPRAKTLPGATATTPPNASVETIEPKVAELEGSQPVAETSPTAVAPEPFSEAEIADLKETAAENLSSDDTAAAPEKAS
ncbi:MAG: hypothetical protein JWM68_1407 [Verrucomicrobiales bacterium]|nr:hypothetical protein [Verrucomicrobiales bacterium]